ncbi:MAG TPA: DUF1016 family protein [Candidatus Onthousia faecipullorum]|uniref:DUF1016 family protein n=1 Tax=Candidatus Onthousia faecipullorum TaxID=2840887 RepID=A0A9D1GAY3_9FIRM|nr:DUF1016 family protein [Candidatus Onthousia faecipullorum]
MNYYKEVESLIRKNEINKGVRALQDNSETLYTYWHIGKLIVEAQGGAKRAKYGDGLINDWGHKLSEKYGKNYDKSNLSKMRKFYMMFPIVDTLCPQLNWSHYRYILPLKNVNERNYYINQVILNNLSVRDLRREIKNKSFDRLSYKDKNSIEIINDNKLTIEDMIKDPIILKSDRDANELNEEVIHKYIISLLENKFLELGTGFALIGHEYKIVIGNNTYHIDLLFYNYLLNAFVVVEVKTRALKSQDIGQLEFYVGYVENNIKKNYHSKTIGVLIVKKNNKYVIEYTTSNDIYVTTYMLT